MDRFNTLFAANHIVVKETADLILFEYIMTWGGISLLSKRGLSLLLVIILTLIIQNQ